MNPMKEYIHHHVNHVNEAFDTFEAKHKKRYRNEQDRSNRRDIFAQNMRFIHSKNRQHLSYTLDANHLTDLTDAEMKMLRGKLKSTGRLIFLIFCNSIFVDFSQFNQILSV